MSELSAYSQTFAYVAQLTRRDSQAKETSWTSVLKGSVEAEWFEHDVTHHEINLVFEVKVLSLDSSVPPPSNEAHLEFVWSEIPELKAHNLLPEPLIECIAGIRGRREAYWGSTLPHSDR